MTGQGGEWGRSHSWEWGCSHVHEQVQLGVLPGEGNPSKHQGRDNVCSAPLPNPSRETFLEVSSVRIRRRQAGINKCLSLSLRLLVPYSRTWPSEFPCEVEAVNNVCLHCTWFELKCSTHLKHPSVKVPFLNDWLRLLALGGESRGWNVYGPTVCCLSTNISMHTEIFARSLGVWHHHVHVTGEETVREIWPTFSKTPTY